VADGLQRPRFPDGVSTSRQIPHAASPAFTLDTAHADAASSADPIANRRASRV